MGKARSLVQVPATRQNQVPVPIFVLTSSELDITVTLFKLMFVCAGVCASMLASVFG